MDDHGVASQGCSTPLRWATWTETMQHAWEVRVGAVALQKWKKKIESLCFAST